MKNWRTRLALLGAVLATAAGALVAIAGTANADVYDGVKARLHWNINLTNGDTGKTCPLTSTLTANLDPATDLEQWVHLEPYGWREFCDGDAGARVYASALLKADGTVEFKVELLASYEQVLTGADPATYWRVGIDQGVESRDLSRSGTDVAAFGHFVASATSTQVNTAVPAAYEYRPEIVSGDVQGYAVITLHREGQWSFEGHLHNNGFSSKEVRVLCAVHSTDGTAMLFEVAGDLNGDLVDLGASKSLDWGRGSNGTSQDIEDAMDLGQFNVESFSKCAVDVDGDTGTDVAAGIGIVIQIGKVLFSL